MAMLSMMKFLFEEENIVSFVITHLIFGECCTCMYVYLESLVCSTLSISNHQSIKNSNIAFLGGKPLGKSISLRQNNPEKIYDWKSPRDEYF